MDNLTKSLMSLPFILVRGEDMRSLLIKKGDRELILEFMSIDDADIVIEILDRTRVPLSMEELISGFPIEMREEIDKIIFRLIDLKILIDVEKADISNFVLDRDFERALDNYFWEREIAWPEFLRYEKTLSMRVVGFNKLGLLIADLLKKMGISDIQLVDYPYLKNKQYEGQKYDESLSIISFDQFLSTKNKNALIIVADEFGNLASLLNLNRILSAEKLCFLPMFISSQIGYIGPLVVPGKTSCFHCLLLRLEQTGGKFNILDASEKEYFEWQNQSSIHPSVVATLAHFFAFQLTSNMGDVMNRLSIETSNIGMQQKNIDLILNYCNMMIEIDLETPKIFKRRVLRKPNCPSCREQLARQKIVFDFVKEYVFS